MARTQGKFYPDNEIYRVKMERLDEDGVTVNWEVNYGPYASEATARGVGTRKNRGGRFRVTIQRAAVDWEDVE